MILEDEEEGGLRVIFCENGIEFLLLKRKINGEV